MSTAATPSTVSSDRRTSLSASSVSSRTPRWPLTARVMMGSRSGSAFCTTGGSTLGGSRRIAPATFSRTSSVASPMSRSSTKVTMRLALPSVIMARISSMPLTEAMASSSGITTCETSSSGLAPGRRTRT